MRLGLKSSAFRALRIAAALFALSFSLWAQGKAPVILIPGLTGSELIDKETGERIWIRAFKSKNEDLRLPLNRDPEKVADGLIPGDIIRSVKVGPFQVADFYGNFIKAMAVSGGYREEKWDAPSAEGFEDSLYVFPYDWRLDIVTNARRLVEDVEDLRRRLGKPRLKFNIVAHSMGGLLARYAAMYGDADLPSGNKKHVPTWAGAKYFDKIILLATPNEGTVSALEGFMHGYSIAGLRFDVPFVQDTSRFTIFSCPSAFQLLPAPGTVRVFDEKLEPTDVDIYDTKVWSKYGWNPMTDPDFLSQFGAAERKIAPAYFEAALARAKALHKALAAAADKPGPVTLYAIGSDCKTALDAVVLYRDEKSDKWKTLFSPKGFTRSDGQKVTDKELRPVMLAPGDGTVTLRSFEASTEARLMGARSVTGVKDTILVCESHSKLAANVKVQDRIIALLAAAGSDDDEDRLGRSHM